MERITSFNVNHNTLEKGMYISRIDQNVITYDIRMKKPNSHEYLENSALHSFEHLFATYARNSKYKDSVLYIGPMGCRTGFYFLTFNTLTHEQALELVIECFEKIKNHKLKVPGSTKKECGNFKEHDLNGAKKIAIDMLPVLKNWSVEKLNYKEFN